MTNTTGVADHASTIDKTVAELTADDLTPGEPTADTMLTNEVPDGNDNYVPVFNAAERKLAYLASGTVGMAGGVASLVSAAAGVPAWVAVLGGCLSLVGSGIAGMFGVHYAGISK
ncbi:hypothetical protein [uncultured Bifidobacterium sp.]|jgi:hypothetical protein|uniref:hypothetical protein n=1 Tax=uncultured Bifidobacterium sp. TaxID=165187 RepID=UPI002588282E|nr:hypothetical protein [uncultured Bifidobacterium sp.]